MNQMGELQALITGAIQGALMQVSTDEGPFLIEVEQVIDGDGNYLPEILVRGRESGECLRIRVDVDVDRELAQLGDDEG